MTGMGEKIMNRVRTRGRGQWVCTPKDFLDLGSRASVDQALSRLVAARQLRRVGRGFYYLPRVSRLTNKPVPADLHSVVAALARRDGVRILPDGLACANRLGLTNAVPGNASYVTDGATRTLRIDGRTIHLRHAGTKVMSWAGRPAAPVSQALRWLGPQAARDAKVAKTLNRKLPDNVKRDLAQYIGSLPAWATPIVFNLTLSGTTAS